MEAGSMIEALEQASPSQIRFHREAIERRQRLNPKPIAVAAPVVAVAAPVIAAVWPPIRNAGQCKYDYANFAGYRMPSPRYVPIRVIQKAVSQYFQISMENLLSHRRSQAICLPRHIAVWVARKATLRSLPYIAKSFSGRDHTTAINSYRKIERLRAANDPVVLAAIDAIGSSLGIVELLEAR
jgi:hypothetical protein